MKNKGHLALSIIISTIIITQISASAWAMESVDHSGFAVLLKKHVQKGLVNYKELKKDEQQLSLYLSQLEKVDPQKLNRSEQMAFYINAYNAWTIKLILENYPGVKSIKDLGTLFKSPWKKKFVKIKGKTITLDHIEHDILRPVFKDPRIHFAVNCASKSCPPLLNEPFNGATLEQQLDNATKSFINNPQNNYMQGDTLYVSRIFKWFGEDFDNNITGFVKSHAQGNLSEKLAKINKNLKVKYLGYDWSLNGK